MPERASASVYLKLIAMRRPGQSLRAGVFAIASLAVRDGHRRACAGRIPSSVSAGDRDGVNATRSLPERSARSCTRFELMMIQSGAVSPSPRPLTGSLLVTLSVQLIADGEVQLSVLL